MTREVRVGVRLTDRALARSVVEFLGQMDGVRLADRPPHDAGAALPPPDVLVLQDPGGAAVGEEVARIRQLMPATEVFLVSSDSQPDHIVDVMKAGAAEFFLEPVDLQRLGQAVEQVRLRLVTGKKPSTRGRLYSFVASKGGVGATVLAVNTAAALALRSAKGGVALLDASLQSGDSSVLLDLAPDTTVADLCRNFQRLDGALLKGALAQHSTGIHFLPAPAAPEDGEVVQAEHLARILELARGQYGYTVVDCSSMGVDERALAIFRASDRVFVVTDLSVPAIRNAARLIRLLEKNGVKAASIEVVVNRYLRGAVPAVPEVERTVGRRVSWLFPNDFKTVVTSINQGVPLVKGLPASAFAKNVQEFVGRLLGTASKGSFRGARGLFGGAV